MQLLRFTKEIKNVKLVCRGNTVDLYATTGKADVIYTNLKGPVMRMVELRRLNHVAEKIQILV